MDYAKGREKPANQAPENSSDASHDRRADWCKEAYSGQAFRSLEKELGNPGYFCHQKSQHNSGDRSAPAPYYPHHENNKHHKAPHVGTIPPVMREPHRSNPHQVRENCIPCEAPGRAQNYAREPYQYYQNSREQAYRVAPPSQFDSFGPQGYDPQFSSDEYGPQRYDQRYVRREFGPQNYAPSNSCNDVCNNPERYNYPGMDYDQSRQYESQQFAAVREQARQQRYSRQQAMINGDIFFNSSRMVGYRNPGNSYQQQWWQDTQLPFEPGRRNMPSGNPELDAYREQWWNQANNPDGSRYYPGRNPELDNQRQQWWEQSQYPGDSRYQPGRNPELNNFRQQWWRNAQTRPDGYYGPQAPPYPGTIDQGYPPDGYENYPPDQYDSRRDQYDPRGDQYDSRDTVQLQSMGRAIKSVLGHSVEEFDRTVPARLGCVRAVSLVLERTYGIPIRDQNTDRVQETLLSNGWVSIDPSRVQEGDVIIGDRGEGKHGHAAIYLGNDQIFNNDSNTGVMQIDSANKFRTGEFVKIKAYRKVR